MTFHSEKPFKNTRCPPGHVLFSVVNQETLGGVSFIVETKDALQMFSDCRKLKGSTPAKDMAGTFDKAVSYLYRMSRGERLGTEDDTALCQIAIPIVLTFHPDKAIRKAVYAEFVKTVRQHQGARITVFMNPNNRGVAWLIGLPKSKAQDCGVVH